MRCTICNTRLIGSSLKADEQSFCMNCYPVYLTKKVWKECPICKSKEGFERHYTNMTCKSCGSTWQTRYSGYPDKIQIEAALIKTGNNEKGLSLISRFFSTNWWLSNSFENAIKKEEELHNIAVNTFCQNSNNRKKHHDFKLNTWVDKYSPNVQCPFCKDQLEIQMIREKKVRLPLLDAIKKDTYLIVAIVIGVITAIIINIPTGNYNYYAQFSNGTLISSIVLGLLMTLAVLGWGHWRGTYKPTRIHVVSEPDDKYIDLDAIYWPGKLTYFVYADITQHTLVVPNAQYLEGGKYKLDIF